MSEVTSWLLDREKHRRLEWQLDSDVDTSEARIRDFRQLASSVLSFESFIKPSCGQHTIVAPLVLALSTPDSLLLPDYSLISWTAMKPNNSSWMKTKSAASIGQQNHMCFLAITAYPTGEGNWSFKYPNIEFSPETKFIYFYCILM